MQRLGGVSRISGGNWRAPSIRLRLLALALAPLAMVLPVLVAILASWGSEYFDRLMVTKVRSDLAVAIKFDLYLSQDGERFVYTSSCALTPGISSFEMWRQPVREFAIGNPRVVDGKRISCD